MAELVRYEVEVKWRKDDDDTEPFQYDRFTVEDVDAAESEARRRHPNDREIWRVNAYPVIRCCGEEIVCTSSWSNPCNHCECEYSRNGYLLAPREQWGEETGERF